MNSKHLSGFLIAIAAIFGAGFACTGSEQSSKPGAPATSPSPVAASTAATPTAKEPLRNLAGNYSAKGTNPNGGNDYAADLVITARDDVYQFSWDSAGRQYDGVGVIVDNQVAVAYADGTNGKSCGVVLYKIGGDGTLDGVAGYWGTNTRETETAKRKFGTDLVGEYDVTGKNTKGETYTAPLSVMKAGAGYEFKWGGANALEGFGIRSGGYVSVGFGGKTCGFVAYEVKPGGELDGKWGDASSELLGTEVAKKK